jgi:putative tryptophan/tyrosine transport system substrate-binding protein
MRRRTFIAGLGSAAAWPVAVRAQQPAMPVVGFINAGSADASASFAAAFRKGLGEIGYVEGQNVAVEYHWLEGQYDRLTALMTDVVRRRVAVIVTPGNNTAALAAKAATSSIPIVFAVGDDPVKLGLVASLAQPGGNATGINFFSHELVSKRLAFLHELVPKAVRVAVLVNPANASSAETALRETREAARTLGLSLCSRRAPATKSMRPSQLLSASTPTLSSWAQTRFSAVAAFNLPRCLRARRFPRPIFRVNKSKPAG